MRLRGGEERVWKMLLIISEYDNGSSISGSWDRTREVIKLGK